MNITYLGHQGWLIRAGNGHGCIVIDYVGQTMGNGPTTVDANYPDIVNADDLYNADAILISHEHADHFNLNVLKRISVAKPGITALVPDLVSTALPAFLTHLGADVLRYSSFRDIRIGDLVVTPLPSRYSRYEPDVYCLLIMDESDGTSFFTPIDALPSDLTIDYLSRNRNGRTLDNFTNNYISRHFRQHGIPYKEKSRHLEAVLHHFDDFIETFASRQVVVSGLGWRYSGDRAELNDMLFPVEHVDIVNARRQQLALLHAAEIGDTLNLSSDNSIVVNRSHSIQGARGFESDVIRDWQPKIMERYVSDERWPILTEWIESNLSAHVSLGARQIKKALHYLMMEGDEASLVLSVLHQGLFHTFAFTLQNPRFIYIHSFSNLDECKSLGQFGIAIDSKSLEGVRCGMDEAHINFEIDAITWNDRWDLLPECTDVDVSACLHPRYRAGVFRERYIKATLNDRRGQ
ncbi:MBL fold metallo-hydrolase [Burkholderia ubonensis]|uniref:MBL fold metallo-hydrolase n=1 Tax=Burkholderia ubonensis TaxID=101571 RepID=UPI002ABE4EB8|nr:MBL fold metallo-hydrolase [Burkholderia ubonensis]